MPRTALLAITFVLAAATALPAPAAVRSPRIIQGGATAIETMPYTVSLGRPGRPALASHFCGGSVVAPDAILTAAHCVQYERAGRIAVTVGRAKLSDLATGQRVGVRAITVHPGWDEVNHDMAILHLTEPVAAPPVTLASGVRAGTFGVVAGWGLTRGDRRGRIADSLLSVELPIRRAAACRRVFGRAFNGGSMVCAGGDGRDSCNGDSGGPLVAMNASGVIEQVGVVSYGGPVCGQRGMPGAYGRISAERDWIASTAVA